MKKTVALFILLTICNYSFAQTPVSNIINSYAAITAYNSCNNNITVSDGSLFNVGDYVLMIQMKGAYINTSNTAAFGTVEQYSNAGNYEFNYITAIAGNTITLKNVLIKTYDILNKVVQLVKVPVYSNAGITGTVTCAPWDGAKGGVLVFKVTNELSFAAGIDVSGKGFRGGKRCANPDGGCANGNTNYSYAVSSGLGAEKGEGITIVDPTMDGGRGAWANGGGGGNKHNSGGAGGGNFTAGGKGGNEANFCPGAMIGGEGGKAMDYTQDRLFLGGGGGCSDNNNGVGTLGSEGGGLVIIEAAKITGNDFSIVSNGVDVPVIVNNIGDGAGGAGAGGTIVISCNNFSSTLNVTANGGKGGDQNTTYGTCFGPGGGGGAGAILFSAISLPTGVITTTLAGRAGVDLFASSPCYLQSYGAAAGGTANGIVFNKTLLKTTTVFVPQQNIKTTVQKCGTEGVLLHARDGSAYTWVPDTELAAASVQNPVCNATVSRTYTVSVTSGTCVYIDTVEVLVNGSPAKPQFAAIAALCQGATAPVLSTSSSNAIPITGTWSPAVINTIDLGSTKYIFTPATGQCADTASLTISIVKNNTNLFPAAFISICPDSVIVLNPGTYSSYLWQDNATSPTYQVAQPGIYSVLVKTADGCTITDTITVTAMVNCTDVFFPTAFSPNGNNANNKTYGPLGNLNAMSNYRMEIYDRLGAVVFRSITPYEKWDGTHKGKAASFGNYVCVASFTYKGKIKRTIKRNVLLIR